MSRFVEVLNNYRNNIGIETFRKFLMISKLPLTQKNHHIEITFPTFLENMPQYPNFLPLWTMNAHLWLIIKENKDFIISVKVPVISVCPCSKEISSYGAHNQRSYVTIKVRYKGMIWIEDLIEVAETSASSPIFSCLKEKMKSMSLKHPMTILYLWKIL